MRKLCWFALPFCGAIFAACYGLPSPVVLILGLAALAAGVVGGVFRRLPVCLGCLGLALGLLWFLGYAALFRAPAEELVGQTGKLTATVADWPRETSTGSIALEVRLQLSGAPDPKVLLYTDDPAAADLRPGDLIFGRARFQAADTVRGETVTYYEARGIFLRANATVALSSIRPTTPSPLYWSAYVAQALKDSVAVIFPSDVAGLMTALLTGDKSVLSDGDYAALQRAGAAHIVAVSGLHISFLAGLLALLFRRRSVLRAVLTILVLVLFAAVAGLTPSVSRAAFMVSMTLLAPLAGREEDKPTTLSAILFLLLLQNPYACQSVSLQLSFASVAGIHLVSAPMDRALTCGLQRGGPWWRRLGRRAWRFFTANLSVTAGALLCTVPLCALYFGAISLVAPLTNLLVLWAVSCAFSLGLPFAVLGIFLPGGAAVLCVPVTWLARYILAAAHLLGGLPFACVNADGLYLCAWLGLVYALLLLVLLFRYRRPILPVCLCAASLCAALALTRLSLFACPLSITMLDVGQGQCILLRSGERTALIDCGGSEDNAGDIAADYLQTVGVTRLDLLVLTHCHSDHANGVPELLSRLEVSALVLPQVAEDESEYREEILTLAQTQGTEITLLSENRVLSFGSALLTLYAPLGDGSVNEEGLFVLASYEDFDLLVTGDANIFVESLLVKYDPLPDIEVLAAGHHGSKYATGDTLLDAVTPETCLISVGYNTYGHPTPETLERLSERGITVYRTDQRGDLTIRYKGD
jgi:competence protein ComEC